MGRSGLQLEDFALSYLILFSVNSYMSFFSCGVVFFLSSFSSLPSLRMIDKLYNIIVFFKIEKYGGR